MRKNTRSLFSIRKSSKKAKNNMEEASMTIFDRKITKIIIGVIISIVLLLSILTILVPFIMLANEKEFLKDELDNTFINEKFSSWKPAAIADWGGFMIPNEWNISNDTDIMKITDMEDNIIAFGTFIGLPDSKFTTYEEFLTATENVDVSEITYDYVPGFAAIDYSYFGKMIIPNADDKTYYYISLKEDQKTELIMVFPPDSAMDHDKLLDIAQAIVFSYCFPEE